MLLICFALDSRNTSRRRGIPERLERAQVFNSGRRALGGSAAARPLAPRPATREELARVHDAGVPRRDRGDRRPRGHARCRHLHVARVGGDRRPWPPGRRVQAAEHALSARRAGVRAGPSAGPSRRARPRDGVLPLQQRRGRRRGRARRGAARVAIVDIDVHHGNGTQWMFYDDPAVLYVSSHQFPFYPGTGAADEIGTGQGKGFTVNVPLEAGATDADYSAGLRGDRRAGARPVRAGADPRLGRLRRARARSAGLDADDRRGLWRHRRQPVVTWRRPARRAGAGHRRRLRPRRARGMPRGVDRRGASGKVAARIRTRLAPAPRGERAVAAVQGALRLNSGGSDSCQLPSSKLQIPTHSQLPTSKSRPNRRLAVGSCELEV